MTEGICQNCIFAAEHSATPLQHMVICHRYPPTPGPDRGIGQFPYVTRKAWCGEFKLDDNGA